MSKVGGGWKGSDRGVPSFGILVMGRVYLTYLNVPSDLLYRFRNPFLRVGESAERYV